MEKGIYTNLFPELNQFPSSVERLRAQGWVRSRVKSLASRAVDLTFYLVVAAVLFGIVEALAVGVENEIGLPVLYTYIIVGVLYFLGLPLTVIWYRREKIRAELRSQLVALDVPICQRCGYNLSATELPRCPECAAPFDLTILERARQRSVKRRNNAMCEHCGNVLQEDSQICPDCGERVKAREWRVKREG